MTIERVILRPDPYTGYNYRYRPGASAMKALMDAVVTHLLCQLPHATKVILKRNRVTSGYKGRKCVSKTYGGKPGSLDKYRARCP